MNHQEMIHSAERFMAQHTRQRLIYALVQAQNRQMDAEENARKAREWRDKAYELWPVLERMENEL